MKIPENQWSSGVFMGVKTTAFVRNELQMNFEHIQQNAHQINP